MVETSVSMLPGSFYDYPKYYDLVYGSDWRAEFRFLQACFAEHARGGAIRSVLEPACGTGRLLYRLGKAGLDVAGLDLNAAAVHYCNERLQRIGLERSAVVADMADFRWPRRVDAGFNMINSFRHLQTEEQARNHFRCLAAAIRPGGLYVLGLHLTPTVGPASDAESWSARRGNLAVVTTMRLTRRDLAGRREQFHIGYDVYTPTAHQRLEDTIDFRTYTARQLDDCVTADGAFDIAAVYDFAYDIHQPIEVGPETEDVVYVLRRR